MLKRILLIFILGITLLFASEMELIRDFGKNPGHLRMFTYIPKNIDTTENYPLVLSVHGSCQSAKSLSRYVGMEKLADSLHFMILYPEQPLYNNLITAFTFYSPKKMKTGQEKMHQSDR
jgi:poly(3-hydroxybutyrate) depolymerase